MNIAHLEAWQTLKKQRYHSPTLEMTKPLCRRIDANRTPRPWPLCTPRKRRITKATCPTQ
jgi:hypothetical protein